MVKVASGSKYLLTKSVDVESIATWLRPKVGGLLHALLGQASSSKVELLFRGCYPESSGMPKSDTTSGGGPPTKQKRSIGKATAWIEHGFYIFPHVNFFLVLGS